MDTIITNHARETTLLVISGEEDFPTTTSMNDRLRSTHRLLKF